MASGSRTLKIEILGDSSDAQRALGKLDASTGQTETRFNKFGAAMKVAMVGAGIAAIKFGKDSVDAFAESQKVAAQTEAVLKSTGGAANVTADDVSKLAGELQNLSGVEDEAIQSGQNMLLTFTNLKNEAGAGNDVFNQATRTLLDMSVALGTNASTSAVQLGKALNDPIKGISALSRVGVTFTDEQKATIRTMVEMGDTAGAQKVILAELNKEFGGSAKAAGDAQTPMEKLSLRFGEIQEKVGAALVPVLEKLTAVIIGVINFVENLNPAVLGVIGVVTAFAGTVVLITKAVQAWTAVQVALTAVLWANPFVLVAAALAALVAGVVIAYQNSETFRNIVDGAFRAVATAALFMRDVAVGAFRTLVDVWLAQVEWIVKGAAAAFGWLPFVGDDLKRAARAFEGFRDDVNRALGGIKPVLINADVSLATQKVADLAASIRRDLGNVLVTIPASSGRVQARAHGGPVTAGQPYIVGDAGRPELFVPRTDGLILPRVPSAGSGPAAPAPPPIVNYNVDVHVAGSVVSENDLVDRLYQGLLKLRRRNGELGLA